MTVAFDISPTYASYFIGQLTSLAIFRSTAGASSPPIETFKRVLDPPKPDFWLDETLAQIQRFRSFDDCWDGVCAKAPDKGSLETAEYLTAFFAQWPLGRRPSLAVDGHGRPTFAAKTAEFYVHLTVDVPGSLTWYALVGPREFFEDDIPFDGSTMPSKLEQLSTMCALDDL